MATGFPQTRYKRGRDRVQDKCYSHFVFSFRKDITFATFYQLEGVIKFSLHEKGKDYTKAGIQGRKAYWESIEKAADNTHPPTHASNI